MKLHTELQNVHLALCVHLDPVSLIDEKTFRLNRGIETLVQIRFHVSFVRANVKSLNETYKARQNSSQTGTLKQKESENRVLPFYLMQFYWSLLRMLFVVLNL